MPNAIQNWFNKHKDEVMAEKEKNEKRGQKCRTIDQKETVIVLSQIADITETVFEFLQADGSVNKVKRYFYWFNPQEEYQEGDESTWPLMVPKSVHMGIIDNQNEYKDKLTAVKITKQGKKKDTEYKVFAQVN